MTDRITIRDLTVPCIVGIKPDERVAEQSVVINLVLECDLAPAAASDRIEETVNYRTLKKQVVDLVRGSDYFLIERLADRIAACCLAFDGVRAVTVTVDKPRALTLARSVAVELRRERPA
jgi:D-erythro-7,8-dihydroneopterin triphosphate epimerase